MRLLKQFCLLVILLMIVVDSRSHRKRRQLSRPNSYYSSYGSNSINPFLRLGLNGYPIGNNWYIRNNQFDYPYGYPYGFNNGYSGWMSGALNFPSGQPYTGQSYMSSSNRWLPLPGGDRRRKK